MWIRQRIVRLPGRASKALAGVVCFLSVATGIAPARADVDMLQFRKDVQWISSRVRTIGSEGYEQTAKLIEEQVGALDRNRVEVQKQDFQVYVPVTDSANLTFADGHKEPIYPFWPAGVRINATPADGITGSLVYAREGKIEEILPKKVDGQIAVLECSASGNWQQLAYFGARAIIFLGSDNVNNSDLRTHDTAIPFNIPRFYVPQGELANRIRAGAITGEVTLRCSVTWQLKTAHNYYVLIKPREARDTPNPADVLSVSYDAGNLVPDLAYSASQAVQTAAGLAMARSVAAQPMMRPVMIFFSGADSIDQMGTKQMLMAFGDVPGNWTDELADLREKRETAASDLEKIRRLLTDPESLNLNRDRQALKRVVDLTETDMVLDQDRLFRIRSRAAEEMTVELKQEEKLLQGRQVMLNQMRYVFTRNLSELLKPEQAKEGKEFIQRAINRLAGTPEGKPGLIQQYKEREDFLNRRIALYRWLANLTGRSADPPTRDNNSRIIEMMIALDLSDRGVRFGPMYRGNLREASNISQIQDYRDWFNRLKDDAAKGKPESQWFNGINRVFDMEPLSNSQAPQTWLAAPMAIGTELCQFWGVPGFSLVTLDDLRLRRDTPVDTIENLDLKAIEPQLQAASLLLTKAWDDPKFKGPVELKWQRTVMRGQVVSPSPWQPVPSLPREGFVAAWYHVGGVRKIPSIRWLPYTMAVRRTEVIPCDAAGNWIVEGLPRTTDWSWKFINVQVYQIEPGTGAISWVSDLGRQMAGMSHTFDVEADNDAMRNPVFRCMEASLLGLIDPRFLQDLGELIPLDARRNAEPQRYNVMVQREIMAGFFEPDMKAFLLFRYGRVGNRLVLLNTGKTVEEAMKLKDADVPARGFRIPELSHLGPLSLVTSRDFFNLDAIRLEKYRQAGVSSELIDQLHTQAGQRIDDAVKAYQTDDGPLMTKHANGAWAGEARVYQATQDMANDVIRAAIFLLLLCVPFSFCMERLTIGTPNIYKQIAGTFGIFAVMAAALWVFHPAFKISSSPLIIILAFAIIFMSLVVIGVVYGKFDTELKRIRSGRGSSQTASFARASVLMSAVLLGIANMRRRKFRTALTATTIVLITFAVLCFTSATRYLDTVTLPTGIQPSHPGIMLRQRGWRMMPENVLANLRAVLGDKQLVIRRWNINAGDPKDQVHLVSVSADGSPHIYATQAILGLSPGESRLSSIAKVIGEAKYARLENGEQNIIYMSDVIAGQLNVKEGQKVQLGGMELEVAGTFDAATFDRNVETLSGEPIAPLKYISGMLDASGRNLNDNALESLDLDPASTAAEMGGNYEHLSASQFVIVPERISQMMPNSSLRSVAFRMDLNEKDVQLVSDAGLKAMAKVEDLPGEFDRGQAIKEIVSLAGSGAQASRLRDRVAVQDILIKEVSDEISKRFAIAIFAGFTEGVKMVAASNLASVSGAGEVAIPLAIAGLIIFNTMMGSIAERRREIHVYTSLGLAPMHVGALFLAEAMTYGLIGAVFGYVIGQGVGTVMMKMHWLGGVTLNYSGTSAMGTLGIILVVVLFSALVPARLASKIAAPSIDRTWRVPAPKDDQIIAALPFTINKTAADGCLAYLAEYFDAHQEGSIGKFSAGKLEAFIFADEVGRKSRGLKTVIWLTPFDLGVRQHLMLLIHPGQFEDIYEVQVLLQRLSGDDGSWYRMNRSFLTELRKQFLQWRSLTPQRMIEYVQQSQALFAKTTDEVVTVVPGESVRLG